MNSGMSVSPMVLGLAALAMPIRDQIESRNFLLQ